MRSTAAQEPYRICVLVNGALSSHWWIRGTRLGLWESTRSITTLRGQGRMTASPASRTMARSASKIFLQWARKRGRTKRTVPFSPPCKLDWLCISRPSPTVETCRSDRACGVCRGSRPVCAVALGGFGPPDTPLVTFLSVFPEAEGFVVGASPDQPG